MFIFAASVFLSAFLLFQIQPMIGKFILPWFGGTPAVWSTAMLFFQVLLTGGYAYAYWLIGRMPQRKQSTTHIVLLMCCLGLMVLSAFFWASPITPPNSLKPDDVTSPIFDVFKLLLLCVGLPYFVLAANGPLMQAWFSRVYPERSYAKLYALSNVGSLLGLLAYPLWIEPSLSLNHQGWLWSAGFVAFACMALGIAWQGRQTQDVQRTTSTTVAPPLTIKFLWIALAGTASLVLLSVTNQISQEVAVIPFLWVLPMMLYLLSFIVTFSGEHGYQRKAYLLVYALALLATIFVMFNTGSLGIYLQIFVYCLFMFAACMLCHGELYLLRPDANHLTTYYLMISIGGALGGLFVSLIAPVIFDGYWEFVVGLALTLAVWLVLIRANRGIKHLAWVRFMLVVFLLVTSVLSLLGSVTGAMFADRNFFGVVRVREIIPKGATEPAYAMMHGVTIHGLQFLRPELRDLPTTYYIRQGGAGLALLHHPRAQAGLKVGMLGLGAGTLAVYGKANDIYRLYEINSIVTDLALGQGGYFSFVKNSPAKIDVVLGDARISLERELAAGQKQAFDVLVLDTFSSDAIPVHLVTQEAFALYLQHLKSDGVIAAHVSNLHLDLKPVFFQLAKHYGLHIASVHYPGDNLGGESTDWLLLTHNTDWLQSLEVNKQAKILSASNSKIDLWTDDYSNLLQILR